MLLRLVVCAASLAALLIPAHLVAGAPTDSPIFVGLIRHDNVPMVAEPRVSSHTIAMLVQQSQVEVLSTKGSWAHVKVWASVTGWVKRSEIARGGPWATVSTYRAPEMHYKVHAYAPRTLHASATTTSPTSLWASPGGTLRRSIPTGTRLRIDSWQQDAAGKIWYEVSGGWVKGDTVSFDSSDPGATRVHGGPIWTAVKGKGMWLTLGIFATGDPNVLATAAQRDGITHIYLETAISPLGFHGRKSVGAAIEAAHRHHIAVLAWVYPYLYDVASDIDLTRQVAGFRTSKGERFDGIAADLEQNVQTWTIRAYSQIVRSYLGAHFLLVGVSYPPQSMHDYPFGELARTYNVIAPMDYWHQTKTAYGLNYGNMAYGYRYARTYASDSVKMIRRASGSIPIEPIGQTFDDFGRLEMGPYAPSAAEIQGFLAGSSASGATGASFFQWMTTTDAEWQAIRNFRF